tara:strand:+ start:819 stop:1034 length:216 start_codon:yes stop_codon:yes gene_type:complete
MTETKATADRVFIDTKELAKRWGKNPGALSNLRRKGEGPNYYKIGGKVLYDLTEIKTLEESSYISNGSRNS